MRRGDEPIEMIRDAELAHTIVKVATTGLRVHGGGVYRLPKAAPDRTVAARERQALGEPGRVRVCEVDPDQDPTAATHAIQKDVE